MSLVINSIGENTHTNTHTHTHIHTYIHIHTDVINKRNFKKPAWFI